MIFGGQSGKEPILELYNALNDSDYKSAEEIDIMTLEDVIYIKMKNDVAFMLDVNYLTLWEQQSTYNPNMPLRGLLYFAELYNIYIEESQQNIYGSKLVKIPTPQYVVFYNGTKNTASKVKLKLSDAFIQSSGEFEWTATMINLNEGNSELLKKCKPLADYVELVSRIREKQKEYEDMIDAITAAVDSCIQDGILSDFLIKHRAEVLNVCLTEYNEKTFVKGIKEEGREEGWREGCSATNHEWENKMAVLSAWAKECGRTAELINAMADSAEFEALWKKCLAETTEP